MENLIITEAIWIPGEALAFSAVRAGGPGGQNVNKVASKVELRVDVARIQGLNEAARLRLNGLIGRHRDASGRWMVTSTRTRDQGRNLEDALEKIRTVVLAALEVPVDRRPTRPTRGSQIRRVEAKKRDGAKKRQRGGSWD